MHTGYSRDADDGSYVVALYPPKHVVYRSTNSPSYNASAYTCIINDLIFSDVSES